MLHVAEELDSYREDFERSERDVAGGQPQWINRIRAAAFDRFVELGFPTTRLEEWKFTNVAPIAATPFRRAGQHRGALPAEACEPVTLGEAACVQLVFVNGRYSPDLSWRKKLPEGVVVSSLATALADNPASVEPYLARFTDYHDQAFVALNTAFLEDGAFVLIPAGTIVEAPIHLLFISAAPFDSAPVSHPRNLIVVGPSSQGRIVESYTGEQHTRYFTNAVTEIVGGEGASIDYYKVQRESEEAFHIATVQAQLGRDSAFSSHAIDLGGLLARNNLGATLDGEGAECTLNGLYVVRGRQHVDNHTRIDHARPHCRSRQLYKGILDETSRGVFNGKVVVHKAAEKSDARQVNKNLLLSDNAVMDSKPQLEIFNNDVKCTHGTTIGRHNQDAIFYLRARGIDLAAAGSLLTYAFASELLGRMTVEPIRTRLDALLLARLGYGSMSEERSWEQ